MIEAYLRANRLFIDYSEVISFVLMRIIYKDRSYRSDVREILL